MKLSDIKPYEKNAKLHDKKQIKLIADSIKRFGFNQPIVIDKNNEIVAGHGRYEGAKLLGMTDVPVVQLDKLTEEEIKAYRLADNQINALTGNDMKLVIEELKLLPDDLFDLTGFDKDLIIEPDEKDDIIPENVPARSKLGDLYELGGHRVLCGDSTQPEAVLRLMEGKKADMVFTDPPYNVDYVGGNHAEYDRPREKVIDNDKMTDDSFMEFLVSSFQNMYDNLKKGGAYYVCHSDQHGHIFRNALLKVGFYLKQCIIWNKNSMVMGRQDYHWKHEPIMYGWKSDGSHKFYGERNQTTVWDMARPSRSSEHPTMKPVELVTKAILNSSKEEDIVLDLFAGGGSTVIACEKTGRICFACELSPKYVDVIIARWELYTGQKATKI